MGKARQRSWGLRAVVAALLLLAVAAFALFRAGVYNVAADDRHYPLTTALLEQVREASIHARAERLTVPKDLMTEARIVQGAGNYNAMCTQCHLAPGMQSTELSRGLYPAPPNLTEHSVDAAEAFWVIKHGIKSTGMPAWGESMDDEYIWNMAAFLQRLPELDAAAYRSLVDRSDGHSHGGGESAPHDHGAVPGAADHPHAPGTPPHDDSPAHVDPPGTPAHSH
jgi:mono/diheme cytochrome c family protein